jgi:adenylyltransferase/sulfurtransferase
MSQRYEMQERYPAWGGEQGQARLGSSQAVVVGVGALGGASAAILVRAGVGRVRLIDPDHPALGNLHRQLLYNEDDVAAGQGKAATAAAHLAVVNSQVRLEAVEAKLAEDNAAELLAGADVVLDGLDNMASRHVLNRACLDLGIPWVHASVAGSRGQVMVMRPGLGPCLCCWSPPGAPEKPGLSVDDQGVLGPTPACVASIQANEALKLLLGAHDALLDGLLTVELWPPRFKTLASRFLINANCPECGVK